MVGSAAFNRCGLLRLGAGGIAGLKLAASYTSGAGTCCIRESCLGEGNSMKQWQCVMSIAVTLLLSLLAFPPVNLADGSQVSGAIKEKLEQVCTGGSTWKDIQLLFGKRYLILEDLEDEREERDWLMAYSLPTQESGDKESIVFFIDRASGAVRNCSLVSSQSELGKYLSRASWYESELIRRLITEFGAPYCFGDEPWGKAEYRGIVVAESKREDVEKVFGKPQEFAGCDEKQKRYGLLTYSGLTGFSGDVSIRVRCKTSTVDAMYLKPAHAWPLEKALGEYGGGYCYRRFFIKHTYPRGDYGKLEEDPRGNVVIVEYPCLGISLHLNDRDQVVTLLYSPLPN